MLPGPPPASVDAVVVGSGPNGLAAAITLQRAGVQVLLLEGKREIGGGLRSADLTLPGFVHDVCSAVHPMAVASPFFQTLPLNQWGLEWIDPPVAAAHPLDGAAAPFLVRSIEETAASLGSDAQAYRDLMERLLRDWPRIVDDALGPLQFFPRAPLAMIRFAWKGLRSAEGLAHLFRTPAGKALWAGMAAHSIQPLSSMATSAIGLVLMVVGHQHGWPIPRGGAGNMAKALGDYFLSLGGRIETGRQVQALEDLPASRAVLLDVTPKQLVEMAGDHLSSFYKNQLGHFRYGMGVFKIDWALDAPIPFLDEACRRAGTVHIGGTLEEIARSEKEADSGGYSERPFVLLAQPTIFDPSRAPAGKHTAWAYCHVPNGSTVDRTDAIEAQVERFAPGFSERILARHTFNTAQLESYNPNYIGGDINGGVIDLWQLFARPAPRPSPYRTSAKGLYLCSSSTPPGGGVHGLCGYHAATRALQDVFGIRP